MANPTVVYSDKDISNKPTFSSPYVDLRHSGQTSKLGCVLVSI